MRKFIFAALAAACPAVSATAQVAAELCEEAPCPFGAAPGQIAVLDPETGELLSGERAAEALRDADRSEFANEIQEQLRAAFDTSNLTEERTATGAVALDLQGRFQSPLVVQLLPGSAPVIAHPEGRPDRH